MKFKRISAAILCLSFILGSITTGFSAETAEAFAEAETAEEITLSDSALEAEMAVVEIGEDKNEEEETDGVIIETSEITNADLAVSGSGTKADPYIAYD
ncbi:MAG: hypothetical protein LIO44_02760 [Eubacterium sp.]|nr:hypothetical protein [Eubacterium sp.]